MRLWFKLLAAEIGKLRHLVVLRAVAASLLIGPGVMILVLGLVSTDITNIVASPLEVVLGSIVLLAAFGAVVLSAAVLGREFDMGTVRAQLSRGVARSSLLLVKIAVVLLSVTVTAVLAAVLGIVEAAAAGWEPTVPQAAEVIIGALALVPLGSLAYVGVTMLGAIVGHSSAAGMLAGLVLFLGDFLLSTLRTRVPLGEWLPVANLFSLLGGTFTAILPSGIAPEPAIAALRLAGFEAAMILAAVLVFRQQDVHQ